MFEILRRMIFPVILIVLLFFVAMIVLQWGAGFSSRGTSSDTNTAALINGEPVTWTDYNRLVDQTIQVETQKADAELPDSKVAEIRQQVWQQILHDRLVMQEVGKYDLRVTDEELYSYLRLSPPLDLQQATFFQTNGQFDYQKYINAMADPQAAGFWSQIETAVRGDILKMKLQELVIQAAHVTEGEIREWFRERNETVTVGMVNVEYKRFSRPPPSPTPEQIQEYFDGHRDKYTVPERAGLNIMLVEKKPLPSDWERSFNIAKTLYDSLKAGADFAEFAGRYSDDTQSAIQGGDLGFFPRGQMVAEFDKWAFQIKDGEISEPIRTEFGWHIIKVHEHKQEKETPRGATEPQLVDKVHASHLLIQTIASEETLGAAFRKIEKFHIAANDNGFFKASEDLRMSIRNAGLFIRGGNIQYLGNDAVAGLFAFDNEVDAISEIFENKASYYVVQVNEKRPAGIAELDDAHDRVRLDLQQSMILAVCRDTMAAITEELASGTDLKKAAKNHGEEYETPDEFTRDSYVNGIRRDPIAIGAAFSLSDPGQILEPVEHGQGIAIFQLISKTEGDLTTFNQQRDSISQVILNGKQKELYGRWFEGLLKDSKVENFIDKALARPQASL